MAAARAFEAAGIFIFSGLWSIFFLRLWSSFAPLAFMLFLGALILAYFLADLLSGLIHWACDTFGTVRTPIWGPLVILAFRRHHEHPTEIFRISIIENLGASAIAGCLALGLLHPDSQRDESASLGTLFLWQLWLGFVFFTVISNLFHRWAHLPAQRKPAWMRKLQASGLILNSERHLRHHQKPHRSDYCVLSGWANSITNRIPWERIEAFLGHFGMKTDIERKEPS